MAMGSQITMHFLQEFSLKFLSPKLALPLLCAAFAATSVLAADAVGPDAAKSRADVKAEAQAASSAGPMAKQGEASAAMAADSKMPVGGKSRADVKADTNAAVRSGDLPKSGEAVAAEAADQKNVPKKRPRKKQRRHAPVAAAPSGDMPAK